MCGLVAAARVDDAFFEATRLVSHRGTEAIRVSSCGPRGEVALAHARLPIVGLGPEFAQPVEVGRWTLAFVGEVLNFRDFSPNAACDLPLVAETWDLHGPGGFQRFDGFWSVVALDERGAIHCLCDYLAQKPLYYRADRHATGVASEPDATAALGPVAPDEVYFSAVIKWGYCPETWRTPYREVHKMLPGEYVRLEAGKRPVRELVDPLVSRSSEPEGLRSEIEQAVQRRVLSSDVPVACLVSGGLDSAITYTLAKRHGDVVPYHVENGETAEAQRVVGSRGVRVVSSPEVVSVDEALAYMQEPVDLGSLFPQVSLSRAVEERVCLTGDGADELFGGYGRAARYDSQWSDVFHELVGYHLPRLDRVMMRNRVEVRSPFLSRRVVEIALGLPRELRTNKRVIRDLFRSDLPDGVADVPKRPLRTAAVESGREVWSRALVDRFRRSRWPMAVRR